MVPPPPRGLAKCQTTQPARGHLTLNLDMKQSEAGVSLHVENSGPPISLDFSPEIPLGARSPRATLNGSMLPVTLEPHGQDLHCRVRFSADKIAHIAITFEPGLRIWLPQPTLRIGDKSRGLRILTRNLMVEATVPRWKVCRKRVPKSIFRPLGGWRRLRGARLILTPGTNGL